MANDVAHGQPQQAHAHDHTGGAHGAPVHQPQDPGVQARGPHAVPQGDAPGHEPQHRPGQGGQVLAVHDLGNHEGHHRQEADDVGVEAVERLGHPGQDGQGGDDVEGDGLAVGVPGGLHVELQAQAPGHEQGHQEQPGPQEDDKHERDRHEHPGAEGDVVAGVLQRPQGDGVGWRAHGRADAADVGRHRDGQGQARARPSLGQRPQDGDDDREHGGGGGRVGHEHAQQGGNDHETQDGPARRPGKGPDEDGREVLVQVVLGGAVGNEEPAQEQDNNGVGQGPQVQGVGDGVPGHGQDGLVGDQKDLQGDDQDGGSHEGDGLKDPEDDGQEEDREHALALLTQVGHVDDEGDQEGQDAQDQAGDLPAAQGGGPAGASDRTAGAVGRRG